MTVRRFFYVRAPHSNILHRMYSRYHSEGVAACGRAVRAGWLWTQRHSGGHMCTQCEAAK